ncbi:MBL fold metallo-hydrolase [uncultured Ornithinimicrobium sp.]|uniref:MBL fold metallo-hydrolase n=1 Tax=uncultured Ornithinimicrobium sp. TaxID=259307 RepID=UPI002591B8EB|nr:MBL fold metallo-hydrolase [uncultured Ornithinimicrobium sp.]
MSTSAEARGHVEAGGPSWVLDLGPATVRKCSVSEMDNNVYLLTCTATGDRLLVDAADDAERIWALLAEDTGSGGGDRLGQVLTTHRHWDHHRALAEVVRRTGATTLAGHDDADELPVPVDVRLGHGDTVQVGRLVLRVVGLRGHTPGSVALELSVPGRPVVLLTGDSLFPGGPGKTWSPEDFDLLIDDLRTRVFDVYGDDTLVLPGHGDNTVLGVERPHLPEWQDRGW